MVDPKANGSSRGTFKIESDPPGVLLLDLQRTSRYTSLLPPDPKVPSIEASKSASIQTLRGARYVDSGLFTWVVPEKRESSRLLAVSSSAMRDIGLKESEKESELFQQITSGNKVFEDTYPWANAYSGWQFGVWAGQLGDGRAISLFESKNPATGQFYEVQLKGAGRTPYSRFADGKAVLRSSIREFLVSEALYALGIPTTRALALTSLPGTLARRERIEPCAIVTRMAETWLRVGTFDLLKNRKSRAEVRLLSDYLIEHVFGGLDKLPSALPGTPKDLDNRYIRLYREITGRNARTTAHWQVYGFLNGVLNTDNTSLYGLSLDFGPFAFMDTFDPMYTSNHDDISLRYSYKNTPTAIWWNLVRLGEALAELLGAGDLLDDENFINSGFTESQLEQAEDRARKVIDDTGKEYQELFNEKYIELFRKRLGLIKDQQDDREKVFQPLLDMLQATEVDFNQFFRKLGAFKLFERSEVDENTFRESSSIFIQQRRNLAPMHSVGEAKRLIAGWLYIYRQRLQAEGSTEDESRKARMNKVNPNFVLKNWILDQVIEGVQQRDDIELLELVLHMSLNPFEEDWGKDRLQEDLFIGDTPPSERDSQCACSS